MITDSETNFLYLADCLPVKYPGFCCNLEHVLKQYQIPYAFIPYTKDIWARDYMPVQVQREKLVQFVYHPDYLKSPEWMKTISNVDAITATMKLKTVKSTLLLDGGNVIKGKDKVILCDKVLKENSQLTPNECRKELENLFEVDKIFFIPRQPYDIIGHADGMIRFLDDDTVLINDYSRESKSFQKAFCSALDKAQLNWTTIPYNPYQNKSNIEATGVYINFLHMQQGILVPTFGLSEDEVFLSQIEQLYRGRTIVPVPCTEIAQEGGVLNCISWTVATG